AEYYLSLYSDGQAPGWINAREKIRVLAEYCRSNGIRLLIANLPELHEISGYRFQTITNLVHEAATRSGADFVDLLPYFDGQKSSDLWVTPSDPHPNSLAHGVIARGLFEALQLRPQS